jgi:hypothetical protein
MIRKVSAATAAAPAYDNRCETQAVQHQQELAQG